MLKTSDKLPQEHSTEVRGIPVIIQWPKGSTRVGVQKDGTPFKTEMQCDYGFVPNTTTSEDKEGLDVYIGTDEDAEYAYIVEQLDEEGEFDEYKVLLNFPSLEEAEEMYVAHAGDDLLGDISEVPFEYLFDTIQEKKAKIAAEAKFTVIEAFLKNYRHEFDFYKEVASLVQDRLSEALQETGIKAVVSSRAKSPDRLGKKLRKRDVKKHYQTFREIYDDIVDLAGCRVALYMPADRDAVGQIIDKLFVSVRAPKSFPESSKPEEGDILGYTATHYLVRLRPETLRKKELRYADTQIEIQVASVLMHAWAEVTHDLIYKPEKGSLTPEEQKALQNLNVLVKEGEKQLEELQASMESRDGESLRFDVTAALAGALKDRSAGKTASLTLGALKNALDVVAEPVRPSVWASYAQATATLRKARWQKQDLVSPETRKRFESAGVMGDETYFLNEAMDKLAPGKPYNTLWVQPNRNEIIAEAQRMKLKSKGEKQAPK